MIEMFVMTGIGFFLGIIAAVWFSYEKDEYDPWKDNL